jgi:hypothetical protein
MFESRIDGRRAIDVEFLHTEFELDVENGDNYLLQNRLRRFSSSTICATRLPRNRIRAVPVAPILLPSVETNQPKLEYG